MNLFELSRSNQVLRYLCHTAFSKIWYCLWKLSFDVNVKMGVSFTILTFLLLSLTIHCQVSRITLNPTTLTFTNNQTYGTVVITCQPPAEANIKNLFTLGIKRSTKSIVNQNVGTYNSGDSAPTLGPSISGATITGGSASNSITVTMSQVSCLDAGVYTCETAYRDSQDAFFTTTSSDNLTVTASPGQITLTPDPRESIYLNGTRLTLTCNGPIGSEEVQWVWEFKKSVEGWSGYISQSENDISTDPSLPIPIPNSCQKNQESRLSRIITTDDDGRTYRCYVRRGNFNFDQYAAEYLITKVGSQDQTPAPSASKGSQPSSASVGPIVGGVIGGLLLLTIIIVLVYFLWYRKRDKGEKYQPRETDLPKPADETGPYPSYPTSSIPPSQTRFKGGKNVTEKPKNQDGLHYAELDLVRKAHLDDSHDSISSRGTSQGTIEYASIRLY